MSIASIRQSNEERYQRHTLASNSQATWTYENYYDLDDILATNEHVLYHFEPETPKELFPLIQQPTPQNITSRGTNTHLRIWQLPPTRPYGNLIPPNDYKAVTFEGLRAGAAKAQLTGSKRFFYEKGRCIARYLPPDEAHRVARDLLTTLLLRSKYIFLRTVDLRSSPKLGFSEMELDVYQRGLYTEQRLKSWRDGVPRRKQECERNFRRYT